MEALRDRPRPRVVPFLMGLVGLSHAAATDGDPATYFGGTGTSHAYLDWWTSTGTPNYEHSVFLPLAGGDPSEGMALHWKILPGDDPLPTIASSSATATEDPRGLSPGGRIRVALASRWPSCGELEEAGGGWLSFGIAEAGGMPGADLVVAEFSREKGTVATDRFATAYGFPPPDDPSGGGTQDWELLRVTTTSGESTHNHGFVLDCGEHDDDDDDDEGFWMVVELERDLDTGDRAYDRAIRWDADWAIPPHRIIAAWGTGPLGFHGSRRTSTSLRFHSSDKVPAGRDHGAFRSFVGDPSRVDGYFDVRMRNFGIPPVRTKYARECVSLSDLLREATDDRQQPLLDDPTRAYQIVGFEPIIESGFPHHMVLYGSTDSPQDGASCASALTNTVSLQGWAIGEGPKLLPSNTGIPLGPATAQGYNTFSLSMHFDNRGLVQGASDSSGFRLYYTSRLRPQSLSLLLLADPLIALQGQPVVGNPSAAASRHSFDCPSECTSSILSPGTGPAVSLRAGQQQQRVVSSREIVVVSELLHMHETGVSMANRVVRNGRVVHEGRIDYWDNRVSGLFPTTTAGFTILPGDILETECVFSEAKSLIAPEPTVFGTGSQDEMCIAFLYYYSSSSGNHTNDEAAPPLDFRMCGHQTTEHPSCTAAYTLDDLASTEEIGQAFGASHPETDEGSSGLPGPSGDDAEAPVGGASSSASARTPAHRLWHWSGAVGLALCLFLSIGHG